MEGTYRIAVLLLLLMTTPGLAADVSLTQIDALLVANPSEAERLALVYLEQLTANKEVESLKHARVLDRLSEAMWRGGKERDPATRDFAEEAVAIKRRLLDSNDPALSDSLLILSIVLRRNRQFTDARTTMTEALEIRKDHFGAQSIEVAEVLHSLALIAKYQNDRTLYESSLERAFAIRSSKLPANHLDTGKTAKELSMLRTGQGRFTEAMDLAKIALETFHTAFGEDHPFVANAHSAIGLVAKFQQSYSLADEAFLRAEEIHRRISGDDGRGLAGALTNLTFVREAMRDYEAVVRYGEEALSIYLRSMKESDTDLIPLHTNLGIAWLHLGNQQLAERHTGIALAALDSMSHPEMSQLATVLYNLGEIYLGVPDPDLAERYLIRARDVSSNSPDNPYLPEILDKLAFIDYLRGAFPSARETAMRSLRLADKRGWAPFIENVRPRLRLSDIERAEGNPIGALDYALEAERLDRRGVASVLAGMNHDDAMKYGVNRGWGLMRVLSIAVDNLDLEATEIAWNEVIRSRSIVDETISERIRLTRETEDPRVTAVREKTLLARAEVARLVLGRRSEGDKATSEEQLADAQRARIAAEHELSAILGRAARVADDQVTIERIQETLEPGSALLAYTFYLDLAAGPEGNSKRRAFPRYVAFVLRAEDAVPRLIDIGDGKDVDQCVENWVDSMWAWSRDNLPPPSIDEYRKAASSLRRLIWDPVAPALSGVERVFIVPAGLIHYVDIAALTTDDGSFLAENGPLYHHVTAERDLLKPSHPTSRTGKRLLAVGGPDYDSTVPYSALRSRPDSSAEGREGNADLALSTRSARTVKPELRALVPLDYAQREASVIRDVWQSRGKVRYTVGAALALAVLGVVFSRLAGLRRNAIVVSALLAALLGGAIGSWIGGLSSPVTLLVGAAATEEAFKEQAPEAEVLHLATHGFAFLPDKQSSDPEETDLRTFTITASPLLASGVAFAGANHREHVTENEDDGLLTGEEIAALDLSSTDLAVLSACDTAMGELWRGEGVVGLRRAFQYAGVDTVVMRLGPVDDEAAAAWMRRFYAARFQQNLTVPGAIRIAKLGELQRRRAAGMDFHPFFWAGFLASGAWR